MPCIPPQHFCVSHHPSLGHCIEVLPFNIYHDNYCKPNTGSFSFPGIEVASSPKETVPVPGLALHSTISKTINRQDREWCRHSHLVVLLLHRVFGAGRGEQVAHKVLWKNPTGCLSKSPAPENMFRQLMWVLGKCHLETRYARDKGYSQFKFSFHSAPWQVVQNTMFMPWQVWLKDYFLVLGMLRRKGHANNCRGKPLRPNLVLVTENTVHCFWPSAQKLKKKKKDKDHS